jgi:hypothetical protein
MANCQDEWAEKLIFSRFFHGIFPALKIKNKNKVMPQGDKSSYTDKQKRQAEHIEKGYEDRGTGVGEAKRRAWATVNKMTGGGKKSGSGVGKKANQAPARKGGKIGGRSPKQRSK